MAYGNKPTHIVTLEESAVFSAFEVAALVAVFECKSDLTRVAVLDQVARQQKGRPRGR